jgi:hypothetical protein
MVLRKELFIEKEKSFKVLFLGFNVVQFRKGIRFVLYSKDVCCMLQWIFGSRKHQKRPLYSPDKYTLCRRGKENWMMAFISQKIYQQ